MVKSKKNLKKDKAAESAPDIETTKAEDDVENQAEDEGTQNEDTSSKKRGKAKKEEPAPQEETENGEETEAKENGEITTEKKKPAAEKKGKATKRVAAKPTTEPARKSSRTPKPVAKQNGEEESYEKFKAENTNAKSKPKKRSASKSPSKAPAKKAKSSPKKDYEVEEVVGMRVKNGKKEFKIRWKGYKEDDDTWEPEKHLSCQDLIKAYLDEHKDDLVEATPKKTATKKAKTPTKASKGKKTKRK
ncbi:probable chromo domain-containing protein LHP1 isoform X2 [Homalodisca vitripennis]|uniref:probable chromo domain-containing protein LHP1 isoform X2 n=1 Tax=Homalodisca vitripennis TaxID=197043 RepID=UPI001EEAF5F3|nr:probable chromo domain-containing protein LHP1 isoform X2 [Homalodisca vitripennis]